MSLRNREARRSSAAVVAWLALALVICLALGVSSALAAGPGTLVDAGFESRTDGTALDSGIWTLFGAPAKAEYDALRAKNGSLSAWIQGSASTAYTGVIESETGAMSSDGAEIRFWTYFDTTTTGRLVDDIDPSINNAARAFLVNFQNNGALSVYTSKAGNPNGYTTNAYTPVGTYTTGWTQYRLVMDFTNQTYTLSSRANAADAWTPIKAPGATGYAIPMLSASPVTATHGTRWRSYYAAQWWVDDIAYSATGISDPDTTAPAVPTGLSATPDTAQVALSWNANTEPDLSGYNVYRDGVLLTPVPIPAAAYTDALLIDGTYSYTVSAVDNTGNESARSGVVVATVGSVTPPTGPALVDAGFESRTDGTALDASIWTLFGAPAKAEYDTLRAKNGSLSAWIQGTAATAYTGVIESETGAMSSDGAEIRFWTYFDTTTTGRLVDDVDPSINNAARAFLVNFQNNGALSVYTSKAGNPGGYTTNAYTPVGTYTTGWTQYRLVMDFTTQTYTLSSRLGATDAWTPIKAPGATGYGIPMLSASPVTATHGTRWRSYYAAQWWVDDIAYSPTGISDGGTGPDTTAPTAPAALSATDHPADSGGSIDLSWLAASDNVAVTGYRLYRGTAPGVYGAPSALGNVTDYTDATAVTGTRYYYAVSAVDAAGNEGPKSPESWATALNNAPPATPTGLAAAPGMGSITLSWDANTESDLLGYNVYYNGIKHNALPVTATTYTHFGLVASTIYSYRITAVDIAGDESAPSAAVVASSLDYTVPGPPPSLTAVDTPGDTGGSISLSWIAATDDVAVTGYRVRRGTAPGVYDTTITVGTVTSYVDATAVTGTRYYYAAYAVDAAGNIGNPSPEASAVAVDNGGVVPPVSSGTVDAGFESRTDGTALDPSIWTLFSAPAKAEYDTLRAKNGSLSAWIQGTAATAYTGVIETKTGAMSSDGAEIRFWTYFDTTTNQSIVDDVDPSINNAARAFLVNFQNNGALSVYTSKAGNPGGYTTNAYTPVGTYTTGWTQYRLVMDFTNQTYTLSSRVNAADAWTQIKAPGATGYAIPMLSASTVSATHGTRWRTYYAAQMWVDDLTYSSTGITDVFGPYTLTASAGAGGSIAPLGASIVAYGASQTYTITPDPGYQIASVLVDGVSVGGPSTYTFTNVSANHTIAASFVVISTGGEMPISYINCESCHAPGSALDEHDHPCADCHAVTDGHPGTPSDMHAPANVTTCAPCHNASITVEHNGRTPDAGGVFVCNTCHGSTDTLVKSAIAAGNTACSACHTSTDHPSLHVSTVESTPLGATGKVCGDCHDANVQPEHTKPSSSSAGAGCSNCHPTPRNTLTPSWDKGCVQGGCHVPGSAAEQHGSMEASHTPVSGQTCYVSGCHPGSATDGLDVTHLGASAELGGQTRTSCMVCHWNGIPATRECATCHADKIDGTHGGVNAHPFIAGSDAVSSGDAGCTNSGSGCHGTDSARANFSTYHPETGCMSGACHTSPSKPTYAGNGDCQTCHASNFTNAPARVSLATEHYNETTHTASGLSGTVTSGGTASATCATCHDPNPASGATGLVAQHTNITPAAGSPYGPTVACVECHNDTRVNGNAEVLAGWTSNACSDCHSVTSSAPQHGTTAPVVATTSSEGCGESGLGCHSTYDVHALHKNASGGCTISGCHDASLQAAKPMLQTCGQAGGCHTTAGSDYHSGQSAAHVSPTISNCFGAGCHAASKSLPDVHAPYAGAGSQYPQYATTCALCHDNDDTNRVNWATATAQCVSCHPLYHDAPQGAPLIHEQRDTAHTPTAASDGCRASGCHDASLPVIHQAHSTAPSDCLSCHVTRDWQAACATCHASSDNWSKTADCSSCHDTNVPHPNVDASHTAVLGDGTITISGTDFGPIACSECHTSPVLTTIHTAGCVTCHPTEKDSLIPAWDKSCAQGECHTVDSAAPMHVAVDAVHAIPAERADCLASGCHSATSTVPLAGRSVADIHSSATTLTPGGQTLASCQICHAGGAPTTDCATSGCHADRLAPHGYNASRHEADETCIGTCHAPLQGLTELQPLHAAVAAPVACAGCHPTKMAEVYPWDKTCAACHTVSGLHPAASASHVGTDTAYQAASTYGNGCSNSSGASGQSNCHDISSLANLHSNMAGSGCVVCHGTGKTPAAECLDCHQPGYSTTYNGNPTVGTHTYHGDNVKYLHDPADAPAGQRFAVNPAHGWYNALYRQDCYDFCHRGNGGAPAFSAPQGSWMWHSVGGDPTDAVTATRKLTLDTMTVPTGSPTLTFDTHYQLGTGAAGYVEISTNGGTNWTRLTGTVGGVSRSSVTGTASGWVAASYNLAAYAGQSVKLRFRYVNGSSTSAGWAFDSLVISGTSGTVFSDDAETLKPDWTNSFWTRSSGAFHQ